MATEIPRLVIAGLSGDSGKTIVSLALLAAWRREGLTVSTFKKGPDYIDAAWLTALGDVSCRNLDTFLVPPDDVYQTFARNASRSAVALIEGNRGVFDGRDADGTHSTAALANLLRAPVVLVVNATKTTRTIAALVMGVQRFDPNLRLAGVILNRVAGKRHQNLVTETIERYCRLPVLGSSPGCVASTVLFPDVIWALVTPAESETVSDLGEHLAELAHDYLNVDRLLAAARDTEALSVPAVQKQSIDASPARVGFFHDRAFTFYYPENLEALEAEGAELVPIDSLGDTSLPDIDALYIGGGFPETHVEQLSQNRDLMAAVKGAGEHGLPIYAECGGLIYLCRSLRCDNQTVAMADLFPVDLNMEVKPVGHGYGEVTVDRENPFFAVGQTLRGHEFHYTGPADQSDLPATCFRVDTGVGVADRRDGLLTQNVFAAYMHLHADGAKMWASALVGAARAHRRRRSGESDGESNSKIEGNETRPCVLAATG